MIQDHLYTRRQMIKSTAAMAGMTTFTPWWDLFSSNARRKYRISACD
jgi:hypothetical protein